MHSRLSTQSIYYSKGKSKEGNKTKQSREKEKQKGETRKKKASRAKQRQRTKQAHTCRQKGVTPFLRKNEIPNFEYRNARIGAI